MRAALAACALALLSLLPGCAAGGTGRYFASRGLDVLDAVPCSVAWGWGLGVSAKATPLLHVGLGLSPIVSQRAGWNDRLINGHWDEFQAALPWTCFLTSLSLVPERPLDGLQGRPAGEGLLLVYRWQMDRDAPSGEGRHPAVWEPNVRQWGRHPPIVRESGGALLIPEWRRNVNWVDLRFEQGDEEPLSSVGTPEHATLWEARRNGREQPQAWDLFEADIFFGMIGLRLGLRPVEFGDLLLGLVGVDPLGDDFVEP
ncbi:MAG: hypothetical protein ACT4PU_02855 [Planctomycetota bacterium]